MDKKYEMLGGRDVVESAFTGLNFGHNRYIDIIGSNLVKVVCGYHIGSGATHLLKTLDLIDNNLEVTRRGYDFLAMDYNDS